jgi:hypothetical protein
VFRGRVAAPECQDSDRLRGGFVACRGWLRGFSPSPSPPGRELQTLRRLKASRRRCRRRSGTESRPPPCSALIIEFRADGEVHVPVAGPERRVTSRSGVEPRCPPEGANVALHRAASFRRSLASQPASNAARFTAPPPRLASQVVIASCRRVPSPPVLARDACRRRWERIAPPSRPVSGRSMSCSGPAQSLDLQGHHLSNHCTARSAMAGD